jgi:hypothetical protein
MVLNEINAPGETTKGRKNKNGRLGKMAESAQQLTVGTRRDL